jgi:hypothetical protein
MAARTLILEATIEGSVIRGTVAAAPGERRQFHGWLEFNTAVEAALCEPALRAEPDRARDSDQLKRR